MGGSSSLPWVNAPQNQIPGIVGDIGDTFVNAARRKKEQDQLAAKNLLDQQRLEADKLRMQAEEHRAAAQERRAQTEEQRAQDTDARAKRIEAAQLVGQAPQMLDNPAQFQALAQAHGLNPQNQTQLPPMPAEPGAAPQEPQQPMAGPLETPEGASNRAVSENTAGASQGQPMQQPDAAAQEVLKQQQERDQYAQALAAHPDLVKQHAAQVDQFKQAKDARAQAEANPVFNLQMPGGPQTIDFGQMRQQQQHALQAKAEAGAKAYPPQYQMQYSAMVSQGIDPVKADAAIDRRMKEDQHAQEMKDFHIPASEQVRLKEAEIAARRHGGKGPAGGGVGRGAAYDAFQEAVQAGTENVGALAAAAGIKPNQIADQVKKIKAESSGAALGFDPTLAVRDEDGTVRGGAPSTRVVKPMQDRHIQYQQAISSLEQLKASGDTIPIGSPLYDKAVLAVAAVTQANASDKTTAHEAGTIKKYGLINHDAIDSVLEDIRTRQHSFLKQLTPVKGEQAEAPAKKTNPLVKAAQGGEPKPPTPDSKRVTYKGQPGYITPDKVFHPDGG